VSTLSPGARAVSAFEIDDIFIVSTRADVAQDFNQTDRKQAMLQAMQRFSVDEKVISQMRAPDGHPEEQFLVVRYFVKAEMYIAKPGSEVLTPEQIQGDRLATMEFVFAVDYRCDHKETPSPESLGAFTKNVVLHMWPYWREAVHAECARMRIPAITIPMLKPGQQLALSLDASSAAPQAETAKSPD
jgi:hypothetical protein